MANSKKDACKAKVSLSNYSIDKNATFNITGFAVEEIEKAGKGAGLVFCPPKGTLLEFPATKETAYIDVDEFTTSDGKRVPVLYGRVLMEDSWQWFPLPVFRRVPTDQYVHTDKDGNTVVVDEKTAFFKDYPLGRELAEVRKSDLDVYNALIGKKYTVEEVFIGHRPKFHNGTVVAGEYTLVYCFKLKKA